MLMLLKKEKSKNEKNKKIISYLIILITPFVLEIILSSIYYYIFHCIIKSNNVSVSILISQTIEILCFLIIPLLLIKIFNFEIKSFFKKIDWKLLIIVVIGIYFAMNIGSILTQISSFIFFNNKVISENYIKAIINMFKKNAYLALFSTMLIAPIVEEFYFRGVLSLSSNFLSKKSFMIFFPIFSGVLFAIVHFDFVRIPYLFTIGFVFAYIFMKTKNLWYTMISHLIINTLASIGVYVLVYLNKKALNIESLIYSETTSLTKLIISLFVNGVILYFIYISFKKKLTDYKLKEQYYIKNIID